MFGCFYFAAALASLLSGAFTPYVNTAALVPSPRGSAWFQGIKPYCNSVEIATRLAKSPPPQNREGTAYEAACYALAGRLEDARLLIEQLSLNDRMYAAGVVFEIGHPVADAGDDRSAGPIMRLVIEYQPANYMALYHAGMSEYAVGEYDLAAKHLKRFLDIYNQEDGWRSNAKQVLQRMEK